MIKLNDLSTGLTLIPDDESKSVHGGDDYGVITPFATATFDDPGTGMPTSTPVFGDPILVMNPTPEPVVPASVRQPLMIMPTATQNKQGDFTSGGLTIKDPNSGGSAGITISPNGDRTIFGSFPLGGNQ
jgi:hypothetical protein